MGSLGADPAVTRLIIFLTLHFHFPPSLSFSYPFVFSSALSDERAFKYFQVDKKVFFCVRQCFEICQVNVTAAVVVKKPKQCVCLGGLRSVFFILIHSFLWGIWQQRLHLPCPGLR